MGLLFVVTLVVVIYFIYKFFPNKGKIVERRVHNKLVSLPQEYLLIDNALFESNGYSTQVDHIVVSPYGVFVIETKGYKGWIVGGENAEYWTQSIYGYKYRFYNPILQNEGHVRFLKFMLREVSDTIPIIPIVVFENDANIRVSISDHIVVYRHFLLKAIKQYSDVVISEELKHRIFETIISNARKGETEEIKHIYNTRSKQRETKEKMRSGICPRCGGALVRREGRYGSFWGCSNYPKCKFTC